MIYFCESKFQHRVEKGWGYEIWVSNSDLYCGKILVIRPGKRTSMHFHKKKTETMYVIEGELVMDCIDLTSGKPYSRTLSPGASAEIVPLEPHALMAGAGVECRIMEVSTQHFESDSYRIEKGD